MKRISVCRAVPSVLAVIVLVASLGFAGPATAAPAGAWYTSYFNLAKANKVTTGAGVTVAVIDTGVQANLADLAGRVLPGRSFVGRGDPRTDVPDPKATYYGHGTAMAAFIAATGKGTGYRGVAPGAKILPAGVASSGTDIDGDAAAKAITWAVDQGAKILNLSIGSPQACPATMQKAVDYATSKDVIVVAAVGNVADQSIGSPANCVGAIGVGALAKSSTFGIWSGQSTGADVDFIAPGDDLSALLLTGKVSNPDADGTSEATALASGAFALLRAKYPKDSARQIVTRALYNVQNKAGAANFGKRINNRIGYGALQPQFALTTAPPADAVNPIYDEIDKHLGAGTPSSGPASTQSTSGIPSGSSTSPAPTASTPDSGGLSAGVVTLIVAVVIVVGLLVIVFVGRSRRNRPTGVGPGGPAGYGPGGYGPPPPGGPPPR